MSLKTLKDIEGKILDIKERSFSIIRPHKLKELAIKWVKEDKELIKEKSMWSAKACLKEWMKRLDIKEGDL